MPTIDWLESSPNATWSTGWSPKAVTLMPQNPDAREMLARAYLGSSRPSRAAPQYKALTMLQPENPKAWYGLARSYEEIAGAAFTALQKEFPDSPLLELIVADIAVTQEKYAAALGIFRRALENKAQIGGLHESISELYALAGKSDWAATELKKATPRTPAYCATRAAECRFLDGKFQESLAAAQRATGAAARFWTVRAANRLAVDAVSRLETLPASVELHLIRAEIAQSRNRFPEGVTEIRAALALQPGNPEIEALTEADVVTGVVEFGFEVNQIDVHLQGYLQTKKSCSSGQLFFCYLEILCFWLLFVFVFCHFVSIRWV